MLRKGGLLIVTGAFFVTIMLFRHLLGPINIYLFSYYFCKNFFPFRFFFFFSFNIGKDFFFPTEFFIYLFIFYEFSVIERRKYQTKVFFCSNFFFFFFYYLFKKKKMTKLDQVTYAQRGRIHINLILSVNEGAGAIPSF